MWYNDGKQKFKIKESMHIGRLMLVLEMYGHVSCCSIRDRQKLYNEIRRRGYKFKSETVKTLGYNQIGEDYPNWDAIVSLIINDEIQWIDLEKHINNQRGDTKRHHSICKKAFNLKNTKDVQKVLVDGYGHVERSIFNEFKIPHHTKKITILWSIGGKMMRQRGDVRYYFE